MSIKFSGEAIVAVGVETLWRTTIAEREKSSAFVSRSERSVQAAMQRSRASGDVGSQSVHFGLPGRCLLALLGSL